MKSWTTIVLLVIVLGSFVVFSKSKNDGPVLSKNVVEVDNALQAKRKEICTPQVMDELKGPALIHKIDGDGYFELRSKRVEKGIRWRTLS